MNNKSKEVVIDAHTHNVFINIAKKALSSSPEMGWYYMDIPFDVTKETIEAHTRLATLGFIRLAGNTVRISQLGKEYASKNEPDYDWNDWEDPTNVFNHGDN